ncbi:MAG: hypothetical protein JXO22_05165, partial [Phycisphaerae bacterium]|nr:hypothetical protein [Phycisphaerae bacterium]
MMIVRLTIVLGGVFSLVMSAGAGGVLTEPAIGESADEVKSLIRVEAGDAITRGVLQHTLSDWDVAGTVDLGRSLDLVVTAADIDRLTAAGIAFDVLVYDVVKAADEVRASYHS